MADPFRECLLERDGVQAHGGPLDCCRGNRAIFVDYGSELLSPGNPRLAPGRFQTWAVVSQRLGVTVEF